MRKNEMKTYLPWNPGFDTYGQTSRNYLIAPNDALSKQICMCYEISDCGKQPFLTAIPDGCHDIIIISDENQTWAYFSVSIDAPRRFDLGKGSKIFGIRFLPGASALQQEDLSQFLDRPAPLEALFPQNDFFVEKLFSAESFTEQKEVIRCFLQKQEKQKTDKQRLLQYCVEKIMDNNGQYSLEMLAEHTGYSERYLHTLFKRYTGTAPKTFAKTIRMQHAAALLQKDIPLSQIAAESGYADQSHMNRDFIQLTNCLPRQLRQNGTIDFSASSVKTTKFI